MTGRRSACGLLAASLLALGPAPAGAQSEVFEDFRKDGTIDPCAYSKGELERARRQLPPDIEQYAPGLGDQLLVPCAAPKTGAAVPRSRSGAAAPPPSRPPASPGRPEVPRPPSPRADARQPLSAVAPAVPDSAGGIPGWLAVLIVLLGLLAGGLMLLARYGGLDAETLTRSLRARLGETGERAADSLAESGRRAAESLAEARERLRARGG